MERLENLNDEVTEGRSSIRVDEDRVERGGWIVNNMRVKRIEVCYM